MIPKPMKKQVTYYVPCKRELWTMTKYIKVVGTNVWAECYNKAESGFMGCCYRTKDVEKFLKSGVIKEISKEELALIEF